MATNFGLSRLSSDHNIYKNLNARVYYIAHMHSPKLVAII